MLVTTKFQSQVNYKIQPQRDGSFVILQKYKHSKKVDIQSSHDTYDEAKDEMDSLHFKPSQAEAMKIINDLKFSMGAIK
jgi:ABC-type molybdate transport system substrate-binding protein